MPTVRPRYQVTETPEVGRALDAAARRWPGEPRSRLLLRLVQVGSEALEDTRADEERRRSAAIDSVAGKYSGVFPAHYLEELREDWPQ